MFFSFFAAFSLSKKLAKNESIYVFGSKANPILNPLESYDFDVIPFCLAPETCESSKLKKITDDRRKSTPISINYLTPVTNATLCSIKITKDVYSRFKKLIQKDFIYELYVGKLPVWGRIGKISQNQKVFVFSHFHFTLSFRDAHVVVVDLVPENPRQISPNSELTFTYSTDWIATNLKYRQRFQKYCDYDFSLSKVRSYAIFNSFLMTLVFLFLVIYVIMRYVGNDFTRYEREQELLDYETDFSATRGWKVLHNDVFRIPPMPALLSSLIGTGAQIFVAVCGFILANLFLRLHFKRNSTMIVGFCVYSLSAFVSGYFSSAMYKRWQGKRWILQLILTSSIIPCLFLIYKLFVWIFSAINGASGAIHYTPLVVGFVLWMLVAVPLSIIGGIIGRHWFFIGELQVKTGIIKRKIPKMPFYLTTPFIGLIIGFCTSLSISMEVYYILCSIWKYKLYFMWWFLLFSVMMLSVISSCATVIATYFRLSAENYEWQWNALIAPAFTGIFVFIECVYFWATKLEHSGKLQVIYMIASSCSISMIVGIACGFAGFTVSAYFVRIIFNSLKID